jgi:hypothetical protein
MKNLSLALTLLLAQTLSAASLTAHLEVSFIGDYASLVLEGNVELLQDALMQVYNCDDGSHKGKYGRDINSATVSLDSLVNSDQTHFSWIMEIEGEAPSCKDQSFFGEDSDTRRQLDNSVQDNNDQRENPALLRGMEASPSKNRELKGKKKKCDCLSLKEVMVLYKEKIADLIQLQTLSSIFDDVTSMQLVDPIDCGTFESFASYINVQYMGDPEGLSDAEIALMATGFVDTFNNKAGEVCDPNFRSLKKAEIIGVQRAVERRLEPEERDEEERNLRVTAAPTETPRPTESSRPTATPAPSAPSLPPTKAPVYYRRPSNLAYLLIRTTGACVGCSRDFRLFDYISNRMLEQWMIPVHSEQHIRNLQGFCFCDQDAVNRGQSTSEFAGNLNNFVQTNDFPSIDEVLGVAETEQPSDAPSEAPSKTPTYSPTMAPSMAPTDAPSMAPTQCIDGLDNTELGGCTVPITLDSAPTRFTLDSLASGAADDFDQCDTLVTMESREKTFYSFEAPANMTISIDTCQDAYDPRFIQIFQGTSGYGRCIGLSKQGSCGTGVGTKIQMRVTQGQKYTINVFLPVGGCYASKDVSQAAFPFKGATVDTYGQMPILPYGCPSLLSVGTGFGDFWRFVANDTKVTLCDFDGVATADSFFVFSGSCHSSSCLGSGTCSGRRNGGLTFNTIVGEPYWIIYNAQDHI